MARTKASHQVDSPAAPDTCFPIVGIGASAGGLEAFEQFFRNVPADSGMAFVLVPHLDPGHASILTEILQRTTSMPVVEAQDQMPVAADHVYVIPPNRDMAIFHGSLQLSIPEQPRGMRLPIDAFLRSLAGDQGERAIGIILSGTGTDGTLGLRAILGAGGISLVQDPATARFDGMPSSAIHAGYATQVLPVERMLQVLKAGRHALDIRHERPPMPETTGGMSRILMLLRSATGHDFSQYKKSTIGRRIERRMSQHNITDTEIYARYLKEQPGEIQALFKELLINVTSFFRDPGAFAVLKQEILPQLCQDKPEGYVIRIWVVGCASGEEAYSVAMLMRELLDEAQRDVRVQIYATDIDEDAIAIARAGRYPPNIVQDLTPERLRRFFIKEEGGYRVRKDLREMVVFAIQDLIKDPPFTKLDLLCCRNLLIYLEPELQSRLFPVFHYALNPGGILFLSPSESIVSHPELFSAQNRKWKFYRAIRSMESSRVAQVNGRPRTSGSSGKTADEPIKKAKETNFAELARRALVLAYAPASVLTDTKGNIVYVYGDTGRYLRPAPGQATLNVVDMARDGLQVELRSAIQGTHQVVPIRSREVVVKNNNGVDAVRLSVQPLSDKDVGEELLLVSFQDIASPVAPKVAPQPQRGKRAGGPAEQIYVEELKRELSYTRENLQATIEEEKTSNEELKSANEEMQSTNEELQSANEELETSKEELQSVNEELVTVNAELQSKIEQLTGLENDMKNLLDNINVGTIFLDEHLVLRRFTREAVRVYRLVTTDVGRPLSDIKSNVDGEDLLAESLAVLDTLVPREHEVRTHDGAWYQARIQPYRTLENVIEGVVLTFADITKRVIAEQAVQAARDMAEAIVDTVQEPLIVLDEKLRVVTASRSFYRRFHVTPEETVGREIYDLGNRQWDIPRLRELLETILPRDRSFEGYEVEHDFPVIGRRKMLLNGRRIVGRTKDDGLLILLAMEDMPATK